MGFSRQEYWSELPFPSLGDLPDPGVELWFPALQANSLPLSNQGSKFNVFFSIYNVLNSKESFKDENSHVHPILKIINQHSIE